MDRTFYWLKIKEGSAPPHWEPAELENWLGKDRWLVIGWEVPVHEEDIIEIGERLIHE